MSQKPILLQLTIMHKINRLGFDVTSFSRVVEKLNLFLVF